MVATSFFSDIVGFTSIAEQISPNDMVVVLKTYFNEMSNIIISHNGVVGDYIGDAVFAMFNAPIQVVLCGFLRFFHQGQASLHAFLACDAALAQQNALKKLRAEWKTQSLPEIRIRIGINTGNVLAGNVGSEVRLKYTFI